MQVIRWGIIGCGDIVRRRVAPALSALPGCEIAAVARRNPDRLERCRESLPAGRGVADWRELVREDSIDAVYIATPVRLHGAQVLEALHCGKHVLCEKPLGLDADECKKMLAASRQSAGKLGVAYYRHYYPAVLRLREIIASGEIGAVLLANATACETFLPGKNHPRRWIVEKAQAGGGSLMDFGCHRIEVLLHLLGRETAVGGVCGTVTRTTTWKIRPHWRFNSKTAPTALSRLRAAGRSSRTPSTFRGLVVRCGSTISMAAG